MDSIIISQKKLANEVFYSFSASRETKQGYYIEPISETGGKNIPGRFMWNVVDKSGTVPFPILATYSICKSDIRLDSLNAGDLREFFKEQWSDFQRKYFDNGNLCVVGTPEIKKTGEGYTGRAEKIPTEYSSAVTKIKEIAKKHGISLSTIDVMSNYNKD